MNRPTDSNKSLSNDHQALRRSLRISLIVISMAILSLSVLYITTIETPFGQSKRSFDAIGGDFTLITNQGQRSLSDFDGEIRVLYFGFTHCPGICPASLATIARTFEQLTTQQQQQVRALMVSIDPERDTPEILAEYVNGFHPRIIGMTGTRAEIDAITEQYAVYQNLLDENQIKIEHTSRYYIIDANGNTVTVMRHSTTVNELAEQLRTLL